MAAPRRGPAPADSGLPPDVAGTVVTVGTFDGVHRGHRHVLERLTTLAASTGWRSVLVTFHPHPLEVVRPADAPRLLTVGVEKLEVLAESGIDYLAVLPFTAALQHYSAEQYVERVLLERFRMRHLLIGYNHGFGRGRSGNVAMLRELGARFGFGVDVVPAVSAADGQRISSTAIRQAVAAGELDRAAEALGRPYALSGRVGHGDARGRSLGFPTLNLELASPRKLLPPDGVYAIRAQTPMGSFGGMMNLGGRPTFGDTRLSVEAHLFDATIDAYGAHVRLDLVARLRDTRTFAGPEALVAQLEVDAGNARRALSLSGRSAVPLGG